MNRHGPHRLENLFGNLAGDRVVADPIYQASKLNWRDTAFFNLKAVPVQGSGQFADDPVGDSLRSGITGTRRSLKVVGQRPAQDQNIRIIRLQPKISDEALLF